MQATVERPVERRQRSGAHFSATGLGRALLRGFAALLFTVAVYVTLVQLDVVRSPLDPSLRGDVELAKSSRNGLRVLFVGNSFTYENAMPSLVRDLAARDAAGPPIFVASYTAPAWRLRSASEDDGLDELLRDVPWNVVVLQEASRIPALPRSARHAEMSPYAEALARDIRSRGAQPALFMTWGYRDGDEHALSNDTFPAMQARLEQGYEQEGDALAAPVVPVGRAWAAALDGRPEMDLWARDGKHPSPRGSYLAACVFYVALTGQAASESSFFGELSVSDASYLQAVATDVVGESGARGMLISGRDALSQS